MTTGFDPYRRTRPPGPLHPDDEANYEVGWRLRDLAAQVRNIADWAEVVRRSYPEKGEEAAPEVYEGLTKVMQHLEWSAETVAKLYARELQQAKAQARA